MALLRLCQSQSVLRARGRYSARSRAVRPLSVLQCGRACCGRHECRRVAQVTTTRYVRRWLMAARTGPAPDRHRVRDAQRRPCLCAGRVVAARLAMAADLLWDLCTLK
eukprot:scaffold4968_cov129-Isochrysis_galbana.AAC.2